MHLWASVFQLKLTRHMISHKLAYLYVLIAKAIDNMPGHPLRRTIGL